MAGRKKYDIDLPDVDPNGIAEAQQLVGAGDVVLDGALCDTGTAAQFDIGDAYSAGVGGVIASITCAADISGVDFTITGKNQDGADVTEVVTGPAATTVQSSTYWKQITQIAADGAVGTDITIGTVDEVSTPTYCLNQYTTEPAGLAVAGLSGTIQFDMQETYDNVIAVGSAASNWIDNQTNKTANLTAQASPHAMGIRLRVDSYSSGAELQFYVSDEPMR